MGGLLFAAAALLGGCDNSPHPAGAERENTLFYTFEERSPRFLDPTSSYAANESPFTYLISEPLYEYHYLKRPYELEPRAAAAVVQPFYLDAAGKRLPDDAPAEQIARAVYDIPLRHDLRYAPHPAFARDAQGRYLYHHLTRAELGARRKPDDFAMQGTREVTAEDYVYAIKRHASPRQEAPLYATFADHVVGLKDFAALLQREDAKLLAGLPASAADKPFLDLRQWPLEGAQALDKYTLRITLNGKYPQWKYWMATTFLAPIPWEGDAFYGQAGMADNGLGWNQWPLGSGPFMMKVYEQDRLHVMVRNPYYHGDIYPCEGEPGDREAGLLDDCGKRTPFVDKIVASNIKERLSMKELFKQGYLDLPAIDRADVGVDFLADAADSDETRKAFEQRGFSFPVTVDITNWYLGFNWRDPVVGRGDTPAQQEKNRKLRQAISIAIDWEEGYERIFRAKGGRAAYSLVPPGVFGSHENDPNGYNPVTHELVDGHIVRRPLSEAKQLLAEAGYPDGRDAATGQPLVLNYDFQRTPTPELKAENDWMVKQFAKLGIQLVVRATDFNQFQEKALAGKHQVFWYGWFADYPDAENFLFLLYGPNAKSAHGGDNIANYDNPEYNALYRKLQTLDDGPEKQQVIDQMTAIIRRDAPLALGYWSYSGLAFQHWAHNGKAGVVIQDKARYYRIDTAERTARLAEWNRPVWWPLLVLAAGVLLIVGRLRASFVAREQATALAGAE
ncbi:MAG: ABC transporter substrate-binding protein [Paucibacter sp.]|nr:ABC transporter substrate-binding protein [Roseateles sp.]